MKVGIIRRILTGVAGEQLAVTLGLFASKELTEKAATEAAAKVQLLAKSVVVLETGERIPFTAALAELGIRAVGQELIEFECKESDLIVPQPRIMLASR